MSPKRARILLLSAGWLAFEAASFGAQPPDAEVEAKQQETMLLWIAGDFERAMVETEALFEMFPSHRRGRAALFHVANRLENSVAAEAESIGELQAILESASEYYARSVRINRDREPSIAERSGQGAERVRAKLEILKRIGAGELQFLEASEKIGDLEASRAAAVYLRGVLDSGRGPADRLLFLMLVHQIDYTDALAARLTEAYARLRDDRPALFENARQKYMGRIAEASAEAIVLGRRALADFGDSPHRLDFHVYLGEAFRFSALAKIARRDGLRADTDADERAELNRAIAADLSEAIANNRRIVDLVRSRLEQSVREQPTDAERASLDRQRRAALDRIAEAAELREPFIASSESER